MSKEDDNEFIRIVREGWNLQQLSLTQNQNKTLETVIKLFQFQNESFVSKIKTWCDNIQKQKDQESSQLVEKAKECNDSLEKVSSELTLAERRTSSTSQKQEDDLKRLSEVARENETTIEALKGQLKDMTVNAKKLEKRNDELGGEHQNIIDALDECREQYSKLLKTNSGDHKACEKTIADLKDKLIAIQKELESNVIQTSTITNTEECQNALAMERQKNQDFAKFLNVSKEYITKNDKLLNERELESKSFAAALATSSIALTNAVSALLKDKSNTSTNISLNLVYLSWQVIFMLLRRYDSDSFETLSKTTTFDQTLFSNPDNQSLLIILARGIYFEFAPDFWDNFINSSLPEKDSSYILPMVVANSFVNETKSTEEDYVQFQSHHHSMIYQLFESYNQSINGFCDKSIESITFTEGD
jgi:hypothetical protein